MRSADAPVSVLRPWAVDHRWVLAVGYVLVFLLLDWVSYIRPFQGLNITPWNPQPALAIALLLWNPRGLWLVWLSLIVAELVVRGLPSNWAATAAATAGLTLSFGAIARAIRMRTDRTLILSSQRDLLWFTGIVLVGTLVSGAVYVCILAAAGVGPNGPILEAIARYWIGDAVGLTVMLPMLMVLTDRLRSASLLATLRGRQWWLIAALISLLLWAVFGGDHDQSFKFFYLLLLPVVWAASRLGLAGAVLAAGFTQIGLIIAVQSFRLQDLSVFELQVLMAAITMTGLALGVAVDEQARTEARLKGSLRLAAAGQMAAALAHELSQPLTALNNYADASALLASSSGVPENERLSRLIDVSQRMAGDARRASEVVKRLRDFFRTGSTQLERVLPARLVEDAIDGQRGRAEALNVRLRLDIEDGLPSVLIDPVQMAVVMRNLIANALDAAADSNGKEIALRARRHGGAVLIEVEDSGPGVDEDLLQTLWEGGASDKPGGMGIGLSICRAIVEAHGGRVWAKTGPVGLFCLSLPVDERVIHGASHAS
ncbi:MAG TPA: MASE1 domain-containing protein [Polyangiaceae bacterium]|nr:MASE1 domain-containing protein [Polyangiaceae bacterium]